MNNPQDQNLSKATLTARKSEITERFGQAPDQAGRTEAEGYKSLDENLATAQHGTPSTGTLTGRMEMPPEVPEMGDSRLIQEDDVMDDESPEAPTPDPREG